MQLLSSTNRDQEEGGLLSPNGHYTQNCEEELITQTAPSYDRSPAVTKPRIPWEIRAKRVIVISDSYNQKDLEEENRTTSVKEEEET